MGAKHGHVDCMCLWMHLCVYVWVVADKHANATPHAMPATLILLNLKKREIKNSSDKMCIIPLHNVRVHIFFNSPRRVLPILFERKEYKSTHVPRHIRRVPVGVGAITFNVLDSRSIGEGKLQEKGGNISSNGSNWGIGWYMVVNGWGCGSVGGVQGWLGGLCDSHSQSSMPAQVFKDPQ